MLVNGYIIAVKSDKPTSSVFISRLKGGCTSVFAPQISVCLRAPLLCRIIVFAIGPALISWHYRPRIDDATVLLAVDHGGRECRQSSYGILESLCARGSQAASSRPGPTTLAAALDRRCARARARTRVRDILGRAACRTIPEAISRIPFRRAAYNLRARVPASR